MTPKWSPHASSLLLDILDAIGSETSGENAIKWHGKIDDAVAPLALFPHLGSAIPPECFWTPPENGDRLRQTLCRPYRIVQESVDDEIHILSIRQCRMLIAPGDTLWH